MDLTSLRRAYEKIGLLLRLEFQVIKGYLWWAMRARMGYTFFIALLWRTLDSSWHHVSSMSVVDWTKWVLCFIHCLRFWSQEQRHWCCHLCCISHSRMVYITWQVMSYHLLISVFWFFRDNQCSIPESALNGLSVLPHEVCELGPARHWTGQTHNTEDGPMFLF